MAQRTSLTQTFYSGSLKILLRPTLSRKHGQEPYWREGYRAVVIGPSGKWRGIIYGPMIHTAGRKGSKTDLGRTDLGRMMRIARDAIGFAAHKKPSARFEEHAEFGRNDYVVRTWRKTSLRDPSRARRDGTTAAEKKRAHLRKAEEYMRRAHAAAERGDHRAGWVWDKKTSAEYRKAGRKVHYSLYTKSHRKRARAKKKGFFARLLG